MNGYERIQAAIKGEKPDTTPIMLHNFMMAAKEAGVSMTQFRESPQIMANVFIQSVEKYKFDGILVDLDTVTLAGAVGVPVDFPEHEPARSAKGNLTFTGRCKKHEKSKY
jgi:uroporphyrinogen decarboxylase